ncbi:MAG: hypothetical protein M9921_01685 [Fimbriimonadaceae bacterium]|nr:hypothetical protein [Chthonomonadaceae bacterium]MCO5295547.1 hypothetical protein [Fimbriimonadaceae bacterium]
MGEGSVPESTEQVRTLPVWVKPLVAFHLLAITLWSLPAPAPGLANGSIVPSVSTDSLPDFARSSVSYVHDNVLLFASRAKTPPAQVDGPMHWLSLAIHAYLIPTGMWQYWDMFAPNPSNLDVWVDAIVEFQDGTRVVHDYPRIATLPLPLKYVQERYRKYLERAHSEDFTFLWPAFAQRIALEEYEKNENNPPVHVSLRRHYRFIQPPGEITPDEYTVHTYYEYDVDQKKLRSDGGTP